MTLTTYLIIHLVCAVVALGLVALTEKRICLDDLVGCLICGPFTLPTLIFLILFYGHGDYIIWQRKDK